MVGVVIDGRFGQDTRVVLVAHVQRGWCCGSHIAFNLARFATLRQRPPGASLGRVIQRRPCGLATRVEPVATPVGVRNFLFVSSSPHRPGPGRLKSGSETRSLYLMASTFSADAARGRRVQSPVAGPRVEADTPRRDQHDVGSEAVFECEACTAGPCNLDVNAARNIAAGRAVTPRGSLASGRSANREPQLSNPSA